MSLPSIFIQLNIYIHVTLQICLYDIFVHSYEVYIPVTYDCHYCLELLHHDIQVCVHLLSGFFCIYIFVYK